MHINIIVQEKTKALFEQPWRDNMIQKKTDMQNMFPYPLKKNSYLDFLTAALNSLPTLNVATFIAGILIFCEGFCGFTPVFASLLLLANVPNPWILTASPFATESTTTLIKPLSMSDAAFFETLSIWANLAISSVLFMEIRKKEIKKIPAFNSGFIAIFFYFAREYKENQRQSSIT